MIDLVFTICLAAAPATCEEQVLTFEVEGAQQEACVLAAPIVFDEFADLYPDWRVRRWRCEDSVLQTAKAE